MADLVEERQGAGLTLEDVAQEVAERGLDLPFRGGRQPKASDRLDVLALVRLEELQAVERQPCPIVRRTRAAVAQDATERRDPAKPAVDLQHAIAFDAAIH